MDWYLQDNVSDKNQASHDSTSNASWIISILEAQKWSPGLWRHRHWLGHEFLFLFCCFLFLSQINVLQFHNNVLPKISKRFTKNWKGKLGQPVKQSTNLAGRPWAFWEHCWKWILFQKQWQTFLHLLKGSSERFRTSDYVTNRHRHFIMEWRFKFWDNCCVYLFERSLLWGDEPGRIDWMSVSVQESGPSN
jgi:hypothetical protein